MQIISSVKISFGLTDVGKNLYNAIEPLISSYEKTSEEPEKIRKTKKIKKIKQYVKAGDNFELQARLQAEALGKNPDNPLDTNFPNISSLHDTIDDDDRAAGGRLNYYIKKILTKGSLDGFDLTDKEKADLEATKEKVWNTVKKYHFGHKQMEVTSK